MQRSDMDWQVLRGAFIVLAGSLVISGLMVGGSDYFASQMQRELARNQADFRAASRRYLAIDEEERLIKTYYPAFVKLYDQGILGEENRLSWIEALKGAGDKIKLPTLNYQVAAQVVHSPAFALDLGPYQLHASSMSLNMQLLHEGDLFQFFESLDRQAEGLYHVSSCRLTRSNAGIIIAPDAANITAQCELEWLSITLAAGGELEF